ncbi:hypothetical protein IYR97_26205 (plasmid) [Pseudomonas fulva]|jgi:hypothetical protein|uniref:Uncharacterized protein n=3 Tax=Pseudomonas TaxID=286 RepID=A0A1X1A156_PSEPU|nr:MULTISPECIES: hypothetical protein [Pseudomonas]MCT8162879.1 hypothetical protein [Pseudomonas sp. HD6422]MCT8181352.1 hypothetical protein [Pseudomonas sp. HD6421]MDH1929056.1 hypothetical protein [Pseudomonas sp. GD03696]MDM1711650.1 hypothetical protein [Pseudomonas sp. 165]ORL52190.1 hypothetical protein B7H18_09250 [Pseudomonas putida]
MQLLTFLQTDNGFCRVYYKDNVKNVFCYQPSHVRGQYALYACSRDGEPSHAVGHQDFKIDCLPDSEGCSTAAEFSAWYLSTVSEHQRISAIFYPQVWVDDEAVEVDPGATTIDVTSEILRLGRVKAMALKDNDSPSDDLRLAVNSPQWVQNWPGPFRVVCSQSIRDYFSRDTVAAAS